MFSNHKFTILLLVAMLLISIAACQPQVVEREVVVTQVVEKEVEVEKVVTVEVEKLVEAPAEAGETGQVLEAEGLVACNPIPEVAGIDNRLSAGLAHPLNPRQAPARMSVETPPASPPRQEGADYLVGVFEDLTTLNFWAANGPDNTIWNSYMLPQRPTMYSLSDKFFSFVPEIALALPEPLQQEGDFWVVEIPIRQDIAWSDGEPFTAEDVAFTANAALRLGLISGNWSGWYDSNFLDHVEAVDDFTVKYYYHTKPGLARHEWGTLQAPILAAHYWAPLVDEAAASIDALGDNPGEEELAVAQTEAQDKLFAVTAEDEPYVGAFLLNKWEPGAFVEQPANPNYYDSGKVVKQYVNGAYEDSSGMVLYGEASGDVALEVQVGPFVDAALYSIYGSQDAAILALQNGEVDAILHPLGLQRGLQDRIEGDPNLTLLENPTNGFRYLSFNNRRRPMNDCAFRQAVAVLIDKEFVTGTILQGVAFPLYSFVPEANAAWYFDDVPKLGQGLSREQRVNLAIAIFEQAGYTWENNQKPAWNADGNHVDPGGRLIMPDGTAVPDLNLWAPSAGYDPLRSTFAIWIESWLNEVGIPVKANLAGFNVLIPRIYTEHDFDMFILGWSLGLFPDYLRDFFHSEQAVEDGNNAGGYINPEFDELSNQILACPTVEECKQLADQIQLMLATEVPYVLLFDTGILEPYRSDLLTYPYTEHLSGLQYAHQGGGPLQSEVNVK
jgi:ABC-type transport system substrate-binding protein